MSSKMNGNNPAAYSNQKIYLYILRYAKADESFKIRAMFQHEIKYTFNRVESIDSQTTDENRPYIYEAELDLLIDNQHRLYHNHEHGPIAIGPYIICLSRKIPKIDKTWRDHEDMTPRRINNPFSIGHFFFFDVSFQSDLVGSAPGKNSFEELSQKKQLIFLGHQIPFWNQLYMYTFYLLRHKKFDIFDTLINQFQTVVEQSPLTFAAVELNDFFQGCLIHLPYAMPDSINQYVANKIIARMTGSLPITKKNFKLTNRDSIGFTSAVLADIKEHSENIFSSVKLEEWVLFRDGLVIYLCSELLSESSDTINLVHQMQNEEYKRDLATTLLLKLEELQRPILALNWTSIFTLVDPTVLTLNSLQLTQSMETYITSLVQVLMAKEPDIKMSGQITDQFNELIRQERLPGKIKNRFLNECIFFLL